MKYGPNDSALKADMCKHGGDLGLVLNICFQKCLLLSLFLKIILFLFAFGCSGSSLFQGLFSSCGEWWLLSSCGAQVSHCGGFSCYGAQARGLQ